MGYFRTLFKGPAYYAYQVSVSPEEAVRRAVAFWRGKRCEVAEYNMDRQLRQVGYTGTEMAGGSAMGVLKEAILAVSVVGLVFLFSSRIRRAFPRPFLIGIVAPLDGPDPNRTELICFHAGGDRGDEVFSPQEYTEHQMIELGRELASQGILLEAPRRFSESALPDRHHPLRKYPWWNLRRAAKKAY